MADDIPAKAGEVTLADGTTVEYSLEDGQRVAWVAQVGYRTCHHAETRPTVAQLKEAGFAARRRTAFLDVAGRCPDCAAQRGETADGPPVKQNVPTGIPCPRPSCVGKLLLMTRRKDGRRFLACSAWYGDTRCDFTSNEIPQHLIAKEAGVPMLPLFDA
jgi:hypothetical protein